ncbi:MAG: DUF4392 domain-containing protein [Candidatus Korarchaeota archaeon]|nr:DUF4392 domain-containing protein [Candidatus Korarchaeota archaeon]NIU84542.1 DUF4392 domain-containing protein [Candidatus Thorarchaeota archaeon]NIW14609.1 DUF4392 domain-containing protein [Candidatus Thorarchaeota archaeon]NIW52681.1 DUF4392 domain-containing protein [Candidatus Korarchaeota archaeon]
MERKDVTEATREKVKNIERLITVDIGGRGIITPIYRESFTVQEELPTLLAAKKIKNRVDQRDYLFITTGFPVPPLFIQETDGPIGAISLARGIEKISEVNPIIVAEEEALPIIKATALAGGLNAVHPDEVKKANHAVALLGFPKEKKQALKKAEEVIERFSPSLLLAVEKVGANEAGVYHNMGGHDISRYAAKIEPLLRQAEDNGVPTIGIGDGGNEIGMGKIKKLIKEEVPYGDTCRCECGKGIAADFATDILVPATVSNWGAHAIIATLSLLVEKDLLHSPEIEAEMLMDAAKAGSVDGTSGYPNGWCDGISTSTHASLMRILKEILK